MGLFDRIKKSLFGKNDEEEKKDEEKQSQEQEDIEETNDTGNDSSNVKA